MREAISCKKPMSRSPSADGLRCRLLLTGKVRAPGDPLRFVILSDEPERRISPTPDASSGRTLSPDTALYKLSRRRARVQFLFLMGAIKFVCWTTAWISRQALEGLHLRACGEFERLPSTCQVGAAPFVFKGAVFQSSTRQVVRKSVCLAALRAGARPGVSAAGEGSVFASSGAPPSFSEGGLL
jgi:hypothetical protein